MITLYSTPWIVYEVIQARYDFVSQSPLPDLQFLYQTGINLKKVFPPLS